MQETTVLCSIPMIGSSVAWWNRDRSNAWKQQVSRGTLAQALARPNKRELSSPSSTCQANTCSHQKSSLFTALTKWLEYPVTDQVRKTKSVKYSDEIMR